MIVGPIPAHMDGFCDLHGTPDTLVSRIVTVNADLASVLFYTALTKAVPTPGILQLMW